MKIGVLNWCFGGSFIENTRKASKLGLDGMQISACDWYFHGDMTPTRLMEIKNFIKNEGIEISAVCGDYGPCKPFYYPDEMRADLDKVKKALDFALELGTNIVTTHIGALSEDTSCPQYESMQKACFYLASYADSVGGHFAVETGPERADILKKFLDSLGSKGVAVNLDPANLTMCAGDDAVKAVYTLKDYIVHTHAKDGIQKIAVDPRRIYASSYYGLEKAPSGCYEEVPLGEGGVDWVNYIKALKDIGYDGYLTIERECGANPEQDIIKAVDFLKNLLKGE